MMYPFWKQYRGVLVILCIMVGAFSYDMQSISSKITFSTQTYEQYTSYAPGSIKNLDARRIWLLEMRKTYGTLQNYLAHVTMLPSMYLSSPISLPNTDTPGYTGAPAYDQGSYDGGTNKNNGNTPGYPIDASEGLHDTQNTCGDGKVARTNSEGLYEECDGAYALDALGNPTRLCNEAFCCIDESPADGICDCKYGFDPVSGSCKAGGEQTNRCGDGRVYDGEGCDDGNKNNLDSCTNTCTPTACVIDYCPSDPREHGYDPTCRTASCSDPSCSDHPSCIWETIQESPANTCDFTPDANIFGSVAYIPDYIGTKYKLIDEFDPTTEYLFIDFLNPNCTAESLRVGEKILDIIETLGENNRCKFVGLVDNFAEKNASTFSPPLDIKYLRNIDSGAQSRTSLGLQPIAGTEYIAIMKHDGSILFQGNEDQVDEYLAAMQRLCTPCREVISPIHAVCGRQDTKAFYDPSPNGAALTKESDALCEVGTVASFAYKKSTHTWVWQCIGEHGGMPATCEATQLYCGDGIKNGTEACDMQDVGLCIACTETCVCDVLDLDGGGEEIGKSGEGNDLPIGNTAKDALAQDGACGVVADTIIYDVNANGDALTNGSPDLCAAGTVQWYGLVGDEWNWECLPVGDADAAYCTVQRTFCGDGSKQVGEGCDDGNTNNNDACSNTCTVQAAQQGGPVGNRD